ncbi:MAG: hypothetical protein ACE5IQ_08985 [Candidatus Methylomirabilales bacterium]
MAEAGWRGYSEHEFQMAVFVRDKIFQHYGVSEEDQALISETLSLLAVYHLRDHGRIILKAALEELFPGFPWGLPDAHQVEEIAREHMEKYDVSPPLKELLFAVLLAEITYVFVAEKKLIWLAPPSGRGDHP